MIKKFQIEVAYFMRRLYEQKLTTTSGGNVSLRVHDKILITPSQTDKGRIKPEEIGILTLNGENLTPLLKPSMESKMHIAIYNQNINIKAIVHAHPVLATSFGISHKKIKTNLTGEARAVLGVPVVAPYALMGTHKLADIVAKASLKSNVIIMENHGILTTGKNLLQAYDRMEVLESSAKMTLVTEFLGERKELSGVELEEIDKLIIGV